MCLFFCCQADSDGVLEPGTPFPVHFSVTTTNAEGNFTIQATSDRGFPLNFSPSLVVETGGSANGTVNITAPLSTTSGTGVTLTIQATAPGAADTNYVVLRLTVLKPVRLYLIKKSIFFNTT